MNDTGLLVTAVEYWARHWLFNYRSF